MKKENQQQTIPVGSCATLYHKRRSKVDWAGVSTGDAFKSNLDYYLRLAAQRRFYRLVHKAQAEVVRRLTGTMEDSTFQPKVKPQLAPCYTNYPSSLSVYAAAGLTAFLEYEARVENNVLYMTLKSYLENPAKMDKMTTVDPQIYQSVAKMVTKWVHTRLLLQDLSRNGSLSVVEIYRLFSASQESLQFHSLSEIIRAVVLFGDVLPHLDTMELHPMTRDMIKKLVKKNNRFYNASSKTIGIRFLNVGQLWVKVLCRTLAPYLPPPSNKKKEKQKKVPKASVDSIFGEKQMNPLQNKYRFGSQKKSVGDDQNFSPLGGPNPPALDLPENAADHAFNALKKSTTTAKDTIIPPPNDHELSSEAAKSLLNFAETVESAGGQAGEWEDMRSDIVEQVLSNCVFSTGPLEGDPVAGHEMSIQLSGDREVGGEIFDRPVELTNDLPACEALAKKAYPITVALQKNLYPNFEEKVRIQRFRTSGTLDPARLALGDFSSTIFKRYPVREIADKRGRPVLVIACDGSGSLNYQQMQMVKILSAAYLQSTAHSSIKMLAALYHSGTIRKGVTAPLVQWIYHPHKSRAMSSRDALPAAAALPDNGTGIQSDVLSIAYIMDEAKQLARGKMIYFILISDTNWNRSFHTELNGETEVRQYFEKTYQDMNGRLHTTLVALGVSEETGFEDLLDEVIPVSAQELEDYGSVAKKVGVYVASCIRERRRMIIQ